MSFSSCRKLVWGSLAVFLMVCGPVLADVVWVEAENHTACNFKGFELSNMGKEALLSGGQWIMKGMDAAAIKQLVPDEGILLKYDVEAASGGQYNFWARVGWYSARADFQWRLNGGQWSDVPRSKPTINLMELGFFCEVSWADLGKVQLKKGGNVLELRYPKVTAANGRMLVALDCFAFVQGKFTPEGPFEPGQTYSGARDKEAAAKVYELGAARTGGRTEVKLDGLWQVARYDDPNMDVDSYEPVKKIPSADEYELRWMAFDVPGNPWDYQPLVFGHRLIYRTRVDVPASHKGHSFRLHFSGTNWIVSVFVNGEPAGTHTGVWVPWDLDISRYVKAGRVNEIAVAVKGTYYALDARSMGGDKSLNSSRNRPLDRKEWTRWVAPMYPSTKGDGDGYEYGIVNPVTLISTGSVYVDDVFVIPSVRKQEIATEVTLRNTGDSPRTVEITREAVFEGSGKVEKVLEPMKVTVGAGEVKTVKAHQGWADAKLWWPVANANMYKLRTTLKADGRVLDVQQQSFGFREVTIEGTGIYINGVRRNFWNWVDVHSQLIEKPQDWVDAWRQDGSRFMRFSHGRAITQVLKTREERLDFYDRAGVPGRLCTMIDGMFITFNLGERTQDANHKPLLIVNEPVWKNFREHMAQVAKAYRNHPSVIFYQVENELVYINGMNIYGGYMDKVEDLMNQVCDSGRAIDPTRPYSVGGGGDLSGKLEINCPHYPLASFDYYPGNAYAIDHYATKIERWPWDRTKPWVVGESCFANELEFGAYVDGDQVFRGVDDARRGKAKFLRMLYGGYRWAGVAGFFPWDNLWNYEDAQKMFSALCAIPRKQVSRLYAGADNELLFKIMNDTLSGEPVEVRWEYKIGGRDIASDRVSMKIEPGFGREYTIAVKAPKTDKRLDGVLSIRLSQKGGQSYSDDREVPVLPVVGSLGAKADVYVLARGGKAAAFLAKAGLKFEKVAQTSQLKGKSGLLIVGPDSLDNREAYGTDILAFAAAGGRVIALEQACPLAGAALPVAIKSTQHFGGYAHPQALGTPLFADLGKDDLIDWAGDGPTYKDVYEKPSQGGRSLAEAGAALEFSPLVEVPCGKGVIVLCQLRVGDKLGLDPAADILMRNMIAVYGDYRPSDRVAAVVAGDDPMLAEKVGQTGSLMAKVGSVDEALDAGRYQAAVIGASRENLTALLKARGKVDSFTAGGGWIVLAGLTPDGLEQFNSLVGGHHMIRPFRIERVTMERSDYKLAATIGNRDVALLSPEDIMHGHYWVSGNTYSYVIDGRDFAPFTQPPGGPDDPMEYKPTKDDKDPWNFVNGMIGSDFWRYIRQIWVPCEPLVFKLRRPDVVKTVKIWNNDNYWTIEDIAIVIDGDESSAISAKLPDSSDLTTIELPEARAVKKSITIEIKSWRKRPVGRKDLQLVGIDNVQFLRPDGGDAIFLDNVGGLVAYERGKGGIMLCQLKFMAEEPRPENAGKKLRILGTLLQNMGVGSKSSAEVAVPGVNVRFTPVVIQEYCNGYLDDKSGKAGWFGRKGQDLSLLPRGAGEFAGVDYHVVDYKTAPIPDCIILGGPRSQPSSIRDKDEKIAGIKVGRRADVLYFLQTAYVSRPVTDQERQRMLDRRRPFVPPTVMKYVLHYADGKSADIDVVMGRNIDHWLADDPQPLEQAQIGWSRPLEGADGKRAVLYSMSAPNPRPDAVIGSIEAVHTDNRATPAIIAITLGDIIDSK